MQSNFESAVVFGKFLTENADAAQFYNQCTPEQKQAIHRQLHDMESIAHIKAFVDHLPSAAL